MSALLFLRDVGEMDPCKIQFSLYLAYTFCSHASAFFGGDAWFT